MRQLQMTRQQRAARARRRAQADTLLPLDPRDPDIVRAKQLQRQAHRDPAVRTPGT